MKKEPFCDVARNYEEFGVLTVSIFKAVQEESYRSTLNMEAKVFFKTKAI
jgi:hypothetical protein